MCIIGVLGILQSQTASLREQVKHLSEANNSLKKISEESEVAIQKHKRDYDNTQVRYLLAGKLYIYYCECRMCIFMRTGICWL